MVNAGLRIYLWEERPRAQRVQRELWSLNGATYEGLRSHIHWAKENGWPDQAAPSAEAPLGSNVAAPSRLVTTETEQSEVAVAGEDDAASSVLARGTAATAAAAATPAAPPDAAADGAAAAAAEGDAAAAAVAGPPPYEPYHTFRVTQGPVCPLAFSPQSAEVLAFGGADGMVVLAAADDPPRLLHVLDSHSQRVTNLDWSPDGSFLLSVSLDGTACLWHAERGTLLRAFRTGGAPLCACAFYPANQNLVVLGTAQGDLLVVNSSTGHLAASTKLQPTAAGAAGVGVARLQAAADLLLAADSFGGIHAYSATQEGGSLLRLQLLSRTPPRGGRQREPSCLQYTPHSALARGPALLLGNSDNELVLYRLHSGARQLEVKWAVRMPQASSKVGAALRPGAAADQPELLLTGGEDCCPHLLDASGGRHVAQTPALTLAGGRAGHAAPVVGVAWAGDESRLASSDREGAVVLWRQVPGSQLGPLAGSQ